MKTILFATSNPEKLLIARTVCAQAGLDIESVTLDIDEIQGEDAEKIVIDKVKRAFEILRTPVVVSDDSWDIPALNGFPGPYMKSMNYWLTSQDFLKLMRGTDDRKIILHQYLAYTDGSKIKVFKNDISGTIIHEPRGLNAKSPNMAVTVLDIDGGKTIAEVFEQGEAAMVERIKRQPDAWQNLIDWLEAKGI